MHHVTKTRHHLKQGVQATTLEKLEIEGISDLVVNMASRIAELEAELADKQAKEVE
jgi:hypothetical protein